MKNNIVIVLMVSFFMNIYSSENSTKNKLPLPKRFNESSNIRSDDFSPILVHHNASSSSLCEFPHLEENQSAEPKSEHSKNCAINR